MYKKFGCRASIVFILVFSLLAAVSYAGGPPVTYTWDGDVDNDWANADNWDDGGNPATPPDLTIDAEIDVAGAGFPVVSAAGAEAEDILIGSAAGSGELTMTGGDLTTSGELLVGNDVSGGTNGGTFTMAGGTLVVADDIDLGNGIVNPSSNSLLSPGVLNMSDGTVTATRLFANLNSSMTMTGGTFETIAKMWLLENSTLVLDGGNIIVGDDVNISHNVAVTVNGGSFIVRDKINFEPDPNQVLGFNPTLTINSGFVRAEDYDLVADIASLNGVTEINGSGLLQIRDVDGTFANWDVATALAIIAEGEHLISSTGTLSARSIIVPDFFGVSNLTFTEVFVIPEPASMLLLGLGGLGLLLRRKRAR